MSTCRHKTYEKEDVLVDAVASYCDDYFEFTRSIIHFFYLKMAAIFFLCCLNETTHVKSEEVKVSKVAKSMINPSWLINMILVAMAAGLYLCKRTSTNLMERHKSLLLECHI